VFPDAVCGLDLERHDHVVVRRAGVAEEAALVHAALREVHRPGAGSRVAAAADRRPRLVCGVDVRDEHAIGTHVERLLDAGPIAETADAYRRFRAAIGLKSASKGARA